MALQPPEAGSGGELVEVAAIWVPPPQKDGPVLTTAMTTTAGPIVERASAGMKEFFSAFTTSETRYFDEERYSESELKKSLADGLTDKKIDAMKRILAAVSVGRDASALFPDVVKNVSFPSLELKKLIYIYLVQYAENNRDLALLSINSFQKDLSDRSQLVRASALRAMASIKVLEVIQLVMVAVKTAATDSSPYVRKTAAQCMTKVYAVDPDQFFELRSQLLRLMSDQEVQVVGSAVMAFHHICVVQPPRMPEEALAEGTQVGGIAGGDSSGEKGSGGFLVPDTVAKLQLALLHPHFKRLCQDILLMDSWAQQCCVDLLTRYSRLFFACPDAKPAATSEGTGDNGEAEGAKPEVPAPAVSEDLLALLRSLKLLLNSSSQGVTLAAACGLCYLAPMQDLPVVTRPLLRCLRQAQAESGHALLVALTPIIEARPELIRPHIREFFVQSFDFPMMKEMKLKILEKLVDETNVQLVLRELQAYITWHSKPDFVVQAVQSITHVALKISTVADSCLRGLVKMLDSKCESLACEAVVALRALLQQRQQSSESGLGQVLPHLVRYLEDLAAPTARASVVWIIGQYQREVPKLAPDVVRKLAKSFVGERQEVKQQIMGLSLKVWAFHSLNATGKSDTEGFTPEDSKALLPRLEMLVDYILELAAFDNAWDIRDTARALRRLKASAKAALAEDSSPDSFGLSYCRACVRGDASLVDGEKAAGSAAVKDTEDKSGKSLESEWTLGSLAQALDFPLDTYRPLPAWAEENSPDELRKQKVEVPVKQEAAKSISSSNIGNVQHMENRVQNPSNIQNLPQVQTLEDLDLFYSEDTSGSGKLAAKLPPPSVPGAAAPTSLEQVSFGAPAAPVGPVGTAVFGEDDESDEESDEDDADWKYCQEAAAPPAAAAPAPSAAQAPAATFEPPPRVDVPEATAPEAAPADATQAAPAVDTSAPAATPAPADATQPDLADIDEQL